MRTSCAVVASLLLGVACSSGTSRYSAGSPAAASASRTATAPGPTVSAQPEQSQFAVIYGGGMGGQSLAIVGIDGRLHGQVTELGRIGGDLVPPFASTTNDSVYYLDGDALMRLQPGGAPVQVRDLPGSSTVRVAFAVSQDDRKIAIALLAFGPTPSPGPGVTGPPYFGMKLYVEDLDGSHHVDLFSSSTAAEWPVGWHGSDLVVAVGAGPYTFGGSLTPYPYFAFDGIHVADAATGRRVATLCGGLPAIGIGTTNGILCAKENGLGGPPTITPVPMALSDWSGKETDLGINCIYGALQPAGDDIACDTNGGVFVMSPDGTHLPLPFPGPSTDFVGGYNLVSWVGHDHLLLAGRGGGTMLYDITAGSSQALDISPLMTVGAIPGGF